ncbi:hypothetical protein BDP81DRAFT_164525 [Colletotrichum phormii]|uniref:Uncharacterized protein n=1 Tax=Colletotrichum phormii TaxID=359342 RepID=A0AAI9ZZ32_9PEZI|nr:uncharacterized protein BDP81DRAFT_164525 [Colletotrichum phormii]KAK1640506.1 hypothetical protein BDP81DRAFT_164525 [Colletotrichum phormii]
MQTLISSNSFSKNLQKAGVHFTLLSGPFLVTKFMATSRVLETSYCTRSTVTTKVIASLLSPILRQNPPTSQENRGGIEKLQGRTVFGGMSFVELPGHRLEMVGSWESCKSVGTTILETYLEGYVVAPIAMPYLPGISSTSSKCRWPWNRAVLWSSHRTGLRREAEAQWT